MVGTMQELRIGVIQRNQAIQEQLVRYVLWADSGWLFSYMRCFATAPIRPQPMRIYAYIHFLQDAIRVRHDAAHSRLVDVIIPEREADHARQRRNLEAALTALETSISGRITATFGGHADSLIPVHHRLDHDLAVETTFHTVDVPAKNERQCGAAIRTMEQEKEALALDNATIAAREAKINARLDAHLVTFARRTDAEIEDRQRQHRVYEGMHASGIERWDKSAADEAASMPVQLASLRSSLAAEEAERRAGDALAVTSITDAMTKIKAEAIKNFGVEEEDDEEEKDDR